jgi:ribosome-binding protein aMBF1 (putative translation factor)
MFEDENQAQLAEITGASMQFCDVCGKPVTGTNVVTRGRGSSPSVAERLLRVCDDCFAEIEGGELSVSDDGADTLGTGIDV